MRVKAKPKPRQKRGILRKLSTLLCRVLINRFVMYLLMIAICVLPAVALQEFLMIAHYANKVPKTYQYRLGDYFGMAGISAFNAWFLIIFRL